MKGNRVELKNQRVDEFEESAIYRRTTLEQTSRLMGIASVSDSSVARRLFPSEIGTLEGQCQCTSSDWSTVCVRLGRDRKKHNVDCSAVFRRFVSDTRFEGVVVFVLDDDGTAATPASREDEWAKLPTGVHSNLLISDSILHITSSKVYRNTMIANTYVSTNVVLVNCGQVTASKSKPQDISGYFGELIVTVGPESGGGRDLSVNAEDTMIDVVQQLRGNRTKSTNKSKTSTAQSINILSQHSIVRDTPTLQNIFLFPYSSIHAATSVRNSLLFPHSSVGNSCTVTNVLLQWNASVMDHSTVSDAFLMEQAHCGPNSIVAASILGPDVHVSAGEIHASVLGPNTNSHHQSLLIGVLWPMGRGNVGYGANVGSNHTGRIPDQETAAGEGTFWGLSCVIKFPVDLSHSPYSVVAAGTSLPPQRVCMPFSLIVGHPASGGNEIIPGWVLQSSPYTLTRNEKKFVTRRKAKRHDSYTGWKIFRPAIMEMCRTARFALMQAAQNETIQGGKNAKTYGIGPNVLTKRGRDVGIRAYSDCLRRYALQGFLTWILTTMKKRGNRDFFLNSSSFIEEFWETSDRTQRLLTIDISTLKRVDWPCFPWEETASFGKTEWEYQRLLLIHEYPISSTASVSKWTEQRLQDLVNLEKDFAARIFKCKKRDDTRGTMTIPGYGDAHVLAEKDPVIVSARKNASDVEKICEAIRKKLSSTSVRSRM